MYKITILIFSLFLISEQTLAQEVSGIVRDAQSREVLPGASVVQQNTTTGAVTDENGRFQFTLEQGVDPVIEVRFIGYQTQIISLNRNRMDNIRVSLVSQAIVSEDVLISAFRADENAPVTYSNLTADEIRDRNFGQDVPFLLQMTPSVVATSDAGHGIGYTGFRVRGVDPQRINVTVNGIPLNDSESHGVFWVNMPDFASSTENIQVQRGVGTSTHGPAAFGASINLQTQTLNPDAYGRVQSTAGSFNTFTNSIQVGTGLLNNGWAFDARFSKITSDGYVDRAFSDMQSLFFSATRHSERSLLKVNVFTGEEQTYQAWYGVPEALLETDRTWNFYTYDNQTDNYRQDHYQVHHTYRISDNWYWNTSLHYTYGRGYFEEFRANDRFRNYGLPNVEIGGETFERTDIIRQRWLDNDFYGAVFSTDYTFPDERLRLTAGGGYHIYEGDHFGEVIWARLSPDADINYRYYDNTGTKTDFNVYAKVDYRITPALSVYGDLQLRTIDYEIEGLGRNRADITQSHSHSFFNPKAGLVYRLSDTQRLYASFAVGSKEPTRRDYTDSNPGEVPKAERMFNWEAGYRLNSDLWRFGVNFYYMDYDNQLINTGDVNDVGSPIRTNVENSYRAGVELEGAVRLLDYLDWAGNITLSRNKVDEFVEIIVNYDEVDADGNFLLKETIFRDSDISFSPSVVANSMFRFRYNDFTTDLNSRYVGRQFLDNTQTESRSLDPYFVTDITFEYTVRTIPYLNALRAGFSVFNLFDHLYESNGYTFGYIAGGELIYENYYYPQAGRHFMGRLILEF